MADWLSFSLLTLGLWGCWGLLNKLATESLPMQAIYLLELVSYALVAGIFLGLERPKACWVPTGMAAALGAGLCGALGLLCFLRALAAGRAAVVVPLTGLYPVVTVLASLLLLQEPLTARQAVGIGLALVAVWLLSQ